MTLLLLLPILGLAWAVAFAARPAWRGLVGCKAIAFLLLSEAVLMPAFWLAILVLFVRRRGTDRVRVVALALALMCGGYAVALTVRCFFLEAFHIPTGSMMPTLMGAPLGDPAGGDRILVDKSAYVRGPVRRWDVAVFRYPLDRSRSFVKRVVGLAGEEVLLKLGDVYSRTDPNRAFTLARKPHDVQDSVWAPVAPSAAFAQWVFTPPEAASSAGEETVVDATASGGSVFCRYPYRITNRVAGTSGGPTEDVFDLRLRVRLSLDRLAEVKLRMIGVSGTAELAFAPGGDGSVTWTSPSSEVSTRVDSPNLHHDGAPHVVSLATYDGVVEAAIDDGAPVEVLGQSEFNPQAASRASNVEIEVSYGKATFAGVALHRDLYYIDGGPGSALCPEGTALRVPDHACFALGDNSPNAKDGRLWRRKVFRMRDGRVVRADTSNVHLEGDAFVVRDEWGIERVLPRSELTGPPQSEACPFVEEDLLRGRVWCIWWPFDRARRFP